MPNGELAGSAVTLKCLAGAAAASLQERHHLQLSKPRPNGGLMGNHLPDDDTEGEDIGLQQHEACP